MELEDVLHDLKRSAELSLTLTYEEHTKDWHTWGTWDLRIDYPDDGCESWTLTLNSLETDDPAAAIACARSTLAGYSDRRDQPGLLPEWREKFRCLPPAKYLRAWPVEVLAANAPERA